MRPAVLQLRCSCGRGQQPSEAGARHRATGPGGAAAPVQHPLHSAAAGRSAAAAAGHAVLLLWAGSRGGAGGA